MQTFCPAHFFSGGLPALIQESVWNIDPEILNNLYGKWASEFDVDKVLDFYTISKDEISEAQHMPGKSWLTGLDLLVWFSHSNDSQLKIVLIGIEEPNEDISNTAFS